MRVLRVEDDRELAGYIRKGLAECAQIPPQLLGFAIMQEHFNFQVRTLPNGNGPDQQAPPFCR
jgi:hypothetical protein